MTNIPYSVTLGPELPLRSVPLAVFSRDVLLLLYNRRIIYFSFVPNPKNKENKMKTKSKGCISYMFGDSVSGKTSRTSQVKQKNRFLV